MRVGIDLHVLQGINQGSKTYLKNLFSEISAEEFGGELFFYFNGVKGVDPVWGEKGEVRDFSFHSKYARLSIGAAIDQMKDGLDFYHSQYISPFFSACSEFVTIHDILFETHPQYFSPAFVSRSRYLVRRSAMRAAQVFTVSEFSKQALVKIYDVPEHKITLTPNGVVASEFRLDKAHAKQIVSERFGLDDYILTVGRLEPRKNHVGLLRAYRSLCDDLEDIPPLVIVGQRDFGFDDIFKFVGDLGLNEHVKILEGVGFSDLVALYRSATVFVYPSFAEGFGIPPLEAMAAQVPVVCSNTTSMSEIFSEAALMVDPFDDRSISSAIKSVLCESGLGGTLVQAGDLVVDRFSWKASAQKLVGAYKKYS